MRAGLLRIVLIVSLMTAQAWAGELPLLLAQRYAAGIEVSQYWVSEKLDGVRAYWDGRQFSLGSGLTDVQRHNPPPVGTRVTYRYRELTPNGLPRFPRFLRIREDL